MKYIIQNAYTKSRHLNDNGEIEIRSDGLIYSELNNLSGLQCLNMGNEELIHKKCIEISKLIKEIHKLNTE